jgi:hypothetical protein
VVAETTSVWVVSAVVKRATSWPRRRTVMASATFEVGQQDDLGAVGDGLLGLLLLGGLVALGVLDLDRDAGGLERGLQLSEATLSESQG